VKRLAKSHQSLGLVLQGGVKILAKAQYRNKLYCIHPASFQRHFICHTFRLPGLLPTFCTVVIALVTPTPTLFTVVLSLTQAARKLYINHSVRDKVSLVNAGLHPEDPPLYDCSHDEEERGDNIQCQSNHPKEEPCDDHQLLLLMSLKTAVAIGLHNFPKTSPLSLERCKIPRLAQSLWRSLPFIPCILGLPADIMSLKLVQIYTVVPASLHPASFLHGPTVVL
jgi:hypothetical protein